jgi:hypothetical protein
LKPIHLITAVSIEPTIDWMTGISRLNALILKASPTLVGYFGIEQELALRRPVLRRDKEGEKSPVHGFVFNTFEDGDVIGKDLQSLTDSDLEKLGSGDIVMCEFSLMYYSFVDKKSNDRKEGVKLVLEGVRVLRDQVGKADMQLDKLVRKKPRLGR